MSFHQLILSFVLALVLGLAFLHVMSSSSNAPTHVNPSRSRGSTFGFTNDSEMVPGDPNGSEGGNLKFKSEQLPTSGVQKYPGGIRIRAFAHTTSEDDGIEATFAEVLNGLRSHPNAALALRDALKEYPEPAFFFECAPISANTLDTHPWECVVLPAPSLYGAQPDPETFRAHFARACPVGDDSTDAVVSFENLGGDSMLVAPCPSSTPATHLAAFLRGSSDAQQVNFWALVATEMLERTRLRDTKPVWLSTSGLGVYWLHMRMDSRPKYYQYGPYKHDT